MFLSVIVSVLNWNFTVCKDTILSVLMHMYSPGRVLLSLCVGRVDVTASKNVTAKRTGGQQDSWTMKEGNRVHSSIFGFSTYFNFFRTDKYFDFHHLCLLELYIFKKKNNYKARLSSNWTYAAYKLTLPPQLQTMRFCTTFTGLYLTYIHQKKCGTLFKPRTCSFCLSTSLKSGKRRLGFAAPSF